MHLVNGGVRKVIEDGIRTIQVEWGFSAPDAVRREEAGFECSLNSDKKYRPCA